MEEVLELEEPVKATMPVDLNQVHPRIWIGNYKAAKVSDLDWIVDTYLLKTPNKF